MKIELDIPTWPGEPKEIALNEGLFILLLWPVLLLPQELGWLNEAIQVPEDRFDHYYAPIWVTVFENNIEFDTISAGGLFSYEELQHEAQTTDPRLRRGNDSFTVYKEWIPPKDSKLPPRRCRGKIQFVADEEESWRKIS